MTDYKTEYKEFLEAYESGTIDGEGAGKMIAILAQYFSMSNTEYGISLKAFNKVARTIEEGSDEVSGKSLSSSKAKIIAAATPEHDALIEKKIDVENLEQTINSLKSLQRGLLSEWNYSGTG